MKLRYWIKEINMLLEIELTEECDEDLLFEMNCAVEDYYEIVRNTECETIEEGVVNRLISDFDCGIKSYKVWYVPGLKGKMLTYLKESIGNSMFPEVEYTTPELTAYSIEAEAFIKVYKHFMDLIISEVPCFEETTFMP